MSLIFLFKQSSQFLPRSSSESEMLGYTNGPKKQLTEMVFHVQNISKGITAFLSVNYLQITTQLSPSPRITPLAQIPAT